MQIELKNYFRTNRILKKSHEIYDYLELTRIATVQTPTLRPSSIATLIRYFIRLIPRFRTRFFPSTYSKLHIKKLFNFQVSLFFNNGYETTDEIRQRPEIYINLFKLYSDDSKA